MALKIRAIATDMYYLIAIEQEAISVVVNASQSSGTITTTLRLLRPMMQPLRTADALFECTSATVPRQCNVGKPYLG